VQTIFSKVQVFEAKVQAFSVAFCKTCTWVQQQILQNGITIDNRRVCTKTAE
jgi:hypothetical protein